MNRKSDFPLSLDPEAWELSVVEHRPRRWLPISGVPLYAVDPRGWQSRAARGFSWHRAGRALKRKSV